MISPTSINGQAGENVTIECMSARPNEAVNNVLRIYRSEQDAFEGFENSAEAMGRLDRDNSGSLTTYTFGPLRGSDNGTILICTSSGESSGNATIIVTCRLLIYMYVQYHVYTYTAINTLMCSFSPVPATITRDPASPQQNPLVLKENGTVTINLIISANPQPTSFTWSMNSKTVSSGNGLTLTLDSFTVDSAKEEHNGTYMLTVTNAVGTGVFAFTLDIQCKSFV